MAGAVLEALLLARLISLKLHKTYAFVTLYWAVAIIIDVSHWVVGWDSKDSLQIALHEPLILAVLYPLLVWDVFEEIKPKLAVTLRFQATRMISGLVVTVIMSGIWALFFLDELAKSPGGPLVQFGLFLWLGSMSVSALFLISVYRATKKQGLALPRNTTVWLWLASIVLAADFTEFLLLLAGPLLSKSSMEVVDMILQLVFIGVIVWCGIRMRPVPSNVSSEPERARL